MADDRPELPPEAGNSDQYPCDPDDDWIKGVPRDLHVEAMRHGFLGRFEDPASQTLYSGLEGGYMFVRH